MAAGSVYRHKEGRLLGAESPLPLAKGGDHIKIAPAELPMPSFRRKTFLQV